MNRTGIEWTDFTWNIVTGCEGPDGKPCDYCYARRIARRFGKTKAERAFRPEFHLDRLGGPIHRKKPARIFVCSMADLFGDWVKPEWIKTILDVVRRAPQHTFQFLTKNPARYRSFEFPPNVWLGATTVDCIAYDDTREPLHYMRELGHITYMSVEPMLGPVRLTGFAPDWIIIGPQNGPGAVPPKRKWVEDLIADARCAGTAVFLKDKLNWNGHRPQESPDERRIL